MGKYHRIQLLFIAVTLLAALLALSSATYAWFTFSSDTNVEPLQGGIGYGDGNLLIANAPDGPFSDYCELSALEDDTLLWPLSTADLTEFFVAREQNRSGISIRFAREDDVAASAVCGSVYLKSEQVGSAVYLSRQALDFGSDAQALAAMRLGLVITTRSGSRTHIFKLDDMGDTAGAEARQTVEQPEAVIAAVDDGGRADFVSDPAVQIGPWCAQGTDEEELRSGEEMLCMLAADEVARVDYYLYLEGCDENCINAVQGRKLALALGFTGISQDAA